MNSGALFPPPSAQSIRRLTLRERGLSICTLSSPTALPPEGGLRGECTGFSPGVVRRVTNALESVDASALFSGGALGFGLTGTARFPDGIEPFDYAARRKRFLDRFDRAAGAGGESTLFHLTEAQLRGAPHLHGVLVVRRISSDYIRRGVEFYVRRLRLDIVAGDFPFLPRHDDQFCFQMNSILRNVDVRRLVGTLSLSPTIQIHALTDIGVALLQAAFIGHWLDIFDSFGVNVAAQHCEPIYHLDGYLRYMDDHFSRDQLHAQRRPESLPENWRGATPRMWGVRGYWPVIPSAQLIFDGTAAIDKLNADRRILRRASAELIRAALVHHHKFAPSPLLDVSGYRWARWDKKRRQLQTALKRRLGKKVVSRKQRRQNYGVSFQVELARLQESSPDRYGRIRAKIYSGASARFKGSEMVALQVRLLGGRDSPAFRLGVLSAKIDARLRERARFDHVSGRARDLVLQSPVSFPP